VGDTITVYDNGLPIGIALALANGGTDGLHTYTITVTHLGITSLPSDPFAVVIDTTAPAKPTIDTLTDDVPLNVVASTKIRPPTTPRQP
jgi:hypothetical protein